MEIENGPIYIYSKRRETGQRETRRKKEDAKYFPDTLTKFPNNETLKLKPEELDTVSLASTQYKWVRELFRAEELMKKGGLKNIDLAKKRKLEIRMDIQKLALRSLDPGERERDAIKRLMNGVYAALETVKYFYYNLKENEGLYFNSRIDALNGIDFIKIAWDKENNAKEVDFIQTKYSKPKIEYLKEIEDNFQGYYEDNVKNLNYTEKKLEEIKDGMRTLIAEVLNEEIADYLYEYLTEKDIFSKLLENRPKNRARNKSINEIKKDELDILEKISLKIFKLYEHKAKDGFLSEDEDLLNNIAEVIGMSKKEVLELISKEGLEDILKNLKSIYSDTFLKYTNKLSFIRGNLFKEVDNFNKKLTYIKNGEIVVENLGRIGTRKNKEYSF